MHYHAMAQDALRGVVKAALKRAASPQGLPGDHHFYITFKTRAAGVSGPPELLSKYPDEMMIVLQNQFWDLAPGETFFSVTLKFGGEPKALSVPYAAVTRFVDPSVQFGLEFEAPRRGRANAEAGSRPSPPARRAGLRRGRAEGGLAGPVQEEIAVDRHRARRARPVAPGAARLAGQGRAGPGAAGAFANWAAIVVAGDWHAHSGAPSEVFDNARRDLAKALVAAGFSPDHVRQFSVHEVGATRASALKSDPTRTIDRAAGR